MRKDSCRPAILWCQNFGKELCCQEAQRRFCHSGPHASLNDFKKWLCAASHLADEAGKQSGWCNWSRGARRQDLIAKGLQFF